MLSFRMQEFWKGTVIGMQKKRLAVIFGGNSTEYEVSLQSAAAVASNVPSDRFELILIGINRDGSWYHYIGEIDRILSDTWLVDALCRPVTVSLDADQKGFLERIGEQYHHLGADLVFPVLHGKNGEDGTLQGIFELAKLPLVGCGTLSSALCMDKDRAHKLVSLAGIAVPRSVTFGHVNEEWAKAQIGEHLSYPLLLSRCAQARPLELRRLWGAGSWMRRLLLRFCTTAR